MTHNILAHFCSDSFLFFSIYKEDGIASIVLHTSVIEHNIYN